MDPRDLRVPQGVGGACGGYVRVASQRLAWYFTEKCEVNAQKCVEMHIKCIVKGASNAFALLCMLSSLTLEPPRDVRPRTQDHHAAGMLIVKRSRAHGRSTVWFGGVWEGDLGGRTPYGRGGYCRTNTTALRGARMTGRVGAVSRVGLAAGAGGWL